MSCSQLLEPNLPMSRWKPSTSTMWLFGFAGHEPGAVELPEREKPCARGAPCQKRGTFSQLQKDSTRQPVWGCRCSCKLGICACALRKERGRENRERERDAALPNSHHMDGNQLSCCFEEFYIILFNKTTNTQRKLNQKLPLNVWLWVLKLGKLQDLHVAGICI